MLLDSGQSPKAVRALTGHRSEEMQDRYYEVTAGAMAATRALAAKIGVKEEPRG